MPRAVISSSKFVADDDSLVLEDEAARVKLVGTALDPANLVTGARHSTLHGAMKSLD